MVDPGGTVDRKAEANRLIAYHGPISRALTAERTALESRLIPVTAYIVVSCIEAWHRYPAIVRQIDAAMPVEKIVDAGRTPGRQINSVYLWGFVNFYLLGRNVMLTFDPANDPVDPTWEVLDFWERAALAYRGDGHRQAWDSEGVVRPYAPDVIDILVGGTSPVGDEERACIKQFNATLVNYLFLLYFDTRVGTGDSGPYELPDGRVLLVRDYYRLGPSDFWWSDVAAGIPFHNLTAALVLDGVRFRVTDFGTSYTDPEDYLDHLVEFGLFTTDGSPDARLRPVDLDALDTIVSAVRTAQAAHYRNVVAMDRDEKIRCGAYVYFSFLRPFAEVAGVDDDIEWTVPRDIAPPLYDMLSQLEGENTAPTTDGDYYRLID